MKQILSLFALAGVACTSFGQASFSDDFEGYTAGDFLSENSATWTTWSGNSGGADDVRVVDDNAHSGSNAIYFEATGANGGPDDIVLPFGGVHNTGHMTFEANLMIKANNGAYFNFQGEANPGGVWSMNCNMGEDGNMEFSDGELRLETTYPNGSWFTLRLEMDLSTNTWELYIDDDLRGEFSATVNQIASLNVYPTNNAGTSGESAFWMDDVSYGHTPMAANNRNAAVTNIIGKTGLAGQQKRISATVRNLGNDPITSFDLSMDYKGQTIDDQFNVNLASLESTTIEIDATVELEAGVNDLTATVSNVNGSGSDDNPADDSKTVSVDPIIPAPGKFVIGEEATGTWCGWCPRGAVMLDRMEENYQGFFQGIAVHNGDPMVVEEYDDGMGDYISGYPSALVDREADIDPSDIETDFLKHILIPPHAVIEVGARMDDADQAINVSLTYECVDAMVGDYRAVAVLVESGVTGTESRYAQANYYSGGGNGEMGGYEALPNPVPAVDMVYDHVARAIAPEFGGLANAFGGDLAVGEVHTLTFKIPIDASWDLSHMHVVGMLIDPAGKIDNGMSATLDDAIANGFTYNTGVTEAAQSATDLLLYPNPATDQAVISLNLQAETNVQVTVRNMMGQTIASRNYGQLQGNTQLPIVTGGWATGLYLVEVQTGEQVQTTNLVVE